MPYCTQQDMIDRFGEEELIQLTDRDRVGIIDDTVIDRAISDASAEIDGMIAGRYPLPLSVVPVSLVRTACNLARYFLYDDAATGRVEKAYEESKQYLKMVGIGQISLGVDESGQKAAAHDGAAMQSGGRVFGRDDNGFM